MLDQLNQSFSAFLLKNKVHRSPGKMAVAHNMIDGLLISAIRGTTGVIGTKHQMMYTNLLMDNFQRGIADGVGIFLIFPRQHGNTGAIKPHVVIEFHQGKRPF